MSSPAPDRIAVDWIAVDWGTSRLRAWAVGAGGSVLAERASDRGMGLLAPEDFEPALLDLVGDWLPGAWLPGDSLPGDSLPGDSLPGGRRIPVVACGMVGARQGWVEAPYRTVPCAPVATPVAAPCRDPRLAVSILPGLSQHAPPDVMRGEETQIAGFLAQEPDFDGVLCLPGTHTKWVRISAGEVVGFRTAMTGDLFAAIGGHTVLRHSLGSPGWSAGAFRAAVEEALSRPEQLFTRLFAVRAETLLHGLDAGAARARLSGLLIGAELAATRTFWLGQRVALIGAADLVDRYAEALGAQGLAPDRADGARATLAGLFRARAAMAETTA